MLNMQNEIKIENVMSVYSGTNGKCCCGCSGKHSYASAHRVVASKDRGYEVTDKDVSDRSVKLIVGKINRSTEPKDVCNQYVSVVIGTRLLIAYFVPSVSK